MICARFHDFAQSAQFHLFYAWFYHTITIVSEHICQGSTEIICFLYKKACKYRLSTDKLISGCLWNIIFCNFHFLFLLHNFSRIQETLSKIIFYRPSKVNAIQSFVAISRGYFWSILLLNKSQRRGIPQRLRDKYGDLFICISLK